MLVPAAHECIISQVEVLARLPSFGHFFTQSISYFLIFPTSFLKRNDQSWLIPTWFIDTCCNILLKKFFVVVRDHLCEWRFKFVGVMWVWHSQRGWARLPSHSQTSPALQVLKQVRITHSGGVVNWYSHHTRWHGLAFPQKDGNLSVKPLRHLQHLVRALLPAPHAPIVGHVPLWDRLPSVQVDRAPAAALRHYFWHYRHRGHIGMGGGRRRQVSLRQYVGQLPRQEWQLEMRIPHGAP